jgi:hypothetical protein
LIGSWVSTIPCWNLDPTLRKECLFPCWQPKGIYRLEGEVYEVYESMRSMSLWGHEVYEENSFPLKFMSIHWNLS